MSDTISKALAVMNNHIIALNAHDEDALAIRPGGGAVHGDELLPHPPQPLRVRHPVQRRHVPALRDVRHVHALPPRRGHSLPLRW